MNRKHVMMVNRFQLFRDRQSATNCGFTLLECMVAISILSIQFLLFYSALDMNVDGMEKYLFQNELTFIQSDCIKNQIGYEFDTSSYPVSYVYPIRFNGKGHINMAQTIYFNKTHFVIELGNGVLLEK